MIYKAGYQKSELLLENERAEISKPTTKKLAR